jgi:hypothetical protein
MSIAVLIQVYDDVRRLAIAGGAVAAGDFRLKKQIAPLEQAGAKAPVFGRVAQAARAVVESDEKGASAALLELASLVNAILYTQGETGINGEIEPIGTVDLGVHATSKSARVLKPLLEAMSTTGSGRYELIRGAVESGVFRDIRLVMPALNALDDPYPDIAELMARKVLPMYCKAIVPELLAKLDIKGRGGNLHRLRLLHRIDPEGSRDTILRALDEGSIEIRVIAIGYLNTTGEDLRYLLEQAKAKAKDVRAAALRAMCAVDAGETEAISALKRAIDGADLELITDRVRRCKVPEIMEYIVAGGEERFAKALAEKHGEKQPPGLARLQNIVLSLKGRKDKKAEAFLLRCFESLPLLNKVKFTRPADDFHEVLADVLAAGTQKMQRALATAHKSLSLGMLRSAFKAARATMTPEAFFDEFSLMLAGLAVKRGKKGSDFERATELAEVLMTRATQYRFNYWDFDELEGIDNDEPPHEPTDGHAHEPHEPPRELDPRWLDAAIDVGAVELVCDLARPGHVGTIKFLLGRLSDADTFEVHGVLRTMVRLGHPGAADAIIDTLKSHVKSKDYLSYVFGPMIAALPRSAYPKFEALVPTLPDKVVDELMEFVLELKNKPE